MNPETSPTWQACGKSIRGASHVRDQRPNQDAIAWSAGPGDGLPLVMAISDGHGSQRSFRSDIGAAIAVDTLSHVLSEFAGLPVTDFLSLKKDAARILPHDLEYRWKRQVLDHLIQYPFNERETETLYVYREKEEGKTPMLNPFLAYGATVLGVLVTRDFHLFLQLGDGDLITVQDDGRVVRPLPHDPRLLGNATTSLCTRSAASDVRIRLVPNGQTTPALILVSTDGYSNSFKDDTEFLQIGPDILGFIRADGLKQVSAQLGEWLEETSRVGSGDDITLGIISRLEEAPRPAPTADEPLSQNTP
ncbi:MAG: protein phosphatase 2C domain-containing protein [Nitrospina sp.]|nr:protein phosphatase 2C domain-containing protein [Nitrospina sp.]